MELIAKDFVIYDSIGQKNKPDLIEYGLNPIRLGHAQFLWGKSSNKDIIDKNQIDIFIRKIDAKVDILCLDIEHWELRNTKESTKLNNLNKLEEIYRIFKKQLPNTKIGYYGIFPIRDYWIPVKNNPGDLAAWKANNYSLRNTASKMDVIFPSLYTFYNSPKQWEKYALANLNEARKYGKPIIAFLWPQYHGSNKLSGYKFIDKDFWRLQLEIVYKYADGVVIWMPAGNKRTLWNDKSEWWIETVEFIAAKNITN